MIARLKIRTPRLSTVGNGQQFYYQQLLLHVPFRNKADLCCGDTPEVAFLKREGILKARVERARSGVENNFLDSLERSLEEIDALKLARPLIADPANVDGPAASRIDMKGALPQEEDAEEVGDEEHGCGERNRGKKPERQNEADTEDDESGAEEPRGLDAVEQFQARVDRVQVGVRIGHAAYIKSMQSLSPSQRKVIEFLTVVYRTRHAFYCKSEVAYPHFVCMLEEELELEKHFLAMWTFTPPAPPPLSGSIRPLSPTGVFV